MGYFIEKKKDGYTLQLRAERLNQSYVNNSKVESVLGPGALKGKRCFIIGGGSSAKDLDFSVLKNEITIGINRSYEFFETSVLYMMDIPYINNIDAGVMDRHAGDVVKKKFSDFKGIKVFLNPENNYVLPKDVHVIRKTVDDSLSIDISQGIRGGTNSGFGAIQLAMALGAKIIYLIGYDMKGSHWHSGYPSANTCSPERMEKYRIELEEFAPRFKVLGANIINLNKDSALKCFEFSDLNSVLKGV